MWQFDENDQPVGLVLLGEFLEFDDAWKMAPEDPRDIIVLALLSEQQFEEILTRANAAPTKRFRVLVHMTTILDDAGEVEAVRSTGRIEVFSLEALPEVPKTPVSWYECSGAKLARSLKIIAMPFPKEHLH